MGIVSTQVVLISTRFIIFELVHVLVFHGLFILLFDILDVRYILLQLQEQIYYNWQKFMFLQT